MASQSRHAEQPPADGAHESLRPHQRKVATALLVVLQKGFKSSTDSLIAMKQIIMSNSPAASLFMELVTEDGKPQPAPAGPLSVARAQGLVELHL